MEPRNRTSTAPTRRPQPPPTARLRHGTDRAVRALFAAAARLRGAPALHPAGTVLTGELRVTPAPGRRLGATLLDSPGTYRCLVRLSKALGTPGALPDAFGLAVRVPDGAGPDRASDLLFTTGGRGPLGRRLPRPRADVLGGPYSTLLPYRSAAGPLLLALDPRRDSRRLAPDPRGWADAVRAGPLRFTLLVAGCRGPWRPLGELVLDGTPRGGAADEPAFDIHTHPVPGLRPEGLVQALRAPAYRGSRRGRGKR